MALKLKRYGPLNTVWIEKVAILAAQWGWTRTQNETDLHKVIGKKENLHWTNITSFGFFWVRREHGVNRTSKERSKNRSWKLSGDVQEDDHKGEISQIKIRYEFCWKFSFTPPAACLPNSPSAAVAVSCYAPVTSAWMNEWMNVSLTVKENQDCSVTQQRIPCHGIVVLTLGCQNLKRVKPLLSETQWRTLHLLHSCNCFQFIPELWDSGEISQGRTDGKVVFLTSGKKHFH